MSRTSKRLVLFVVVAIVGLSMAALVFDRAALSATYARVPTDQVASLLPSYELYRKDYPRTDEQFQLKGSTLRGHVYGADNDRALVIFRHGIFSQHRDYLPLITALVDKGWRVFAYDALGCGESDGDSALGMSQSPLDVEAAVDYARASGMAGDLPVALWGHSWGGFGVAAALGRGADVDACITMSGYETPMKVLDYSATSSFGPIGKLQWPFLWLNTYADFGDDANPSASEAIVASGVPTLVVHGSGDTTVPLAGVSIYDALQARRSDLPAGLVAFSLKDTEHRDGHNNYFYSPESQAYLDECAETLQDMLDDNGDDVTAPEVQEFLATVDLKAANTADPALIEEIDTFLAEALDR